MGIEQVPDGQEVVAFLGALDGPEDRWVIGVGALTETVLAVPGPEGEVSRPVEGRAQLVSFTGPITGPFMVIVNGTEASGAALMGGRLVRAISAGVALHVSSGTPVAPRTGVTPGPARPRASALGSDDDEADEAPRYGDRVDHFVFGLCDVMTLREERMKIRDASGTGRLREIHLGAMKVLKPIIQDGHRVFKLVRKG